MSLRMFQKRRGVLRLLYSTAALMALIHVVVLTAGVGFGVWSGRLDREKIETIAAVLRGEAPAPAETEPQDASIIEPQGSADTSAQVIQEAIEKEEMQRFRQQRALADVRQLNMMWDRRALKLQKDQEAFEQRVQKYERQVQKRREQDLSDAHKKMIATIGKMDPKKGRDFLISNSEADAVKILLELSVRKRKAILEACKTEEETEWRDRVLKAMTRQPILAGQGGGGTENP